MIDLRPTIDRLGLGLIRNCNCQRDCGRVIRQAKKGRTQTNPNPIDEENVGIQIQFQISFFMIGLGCTVWLQSHRQQASQTGSGQTTCGNNQTVYQRLAKKVVLCSSR